MDSTMMMLLHAWLPLVLLVAATSMLCGGKKKADKMQDRAAPAAGGAAAPKPPAPGSKKMRLTREQEEILAHETKKAHIFVEMDAWPTKRLVRCSLRQARIIKRILDTTPSNVQAYYGNDMEGGARGLEPGSFVGVWVSTELEEAQLDELLEATLPGIHTTGYKVQDAPNDAVERLREIYEGNKGI